VLALSVSRALRPTAMPTALPADVPLPPGLDLPMEVSQFSPLGTLPEPAKIPMKAHANARKKEEVPTTASSAEASTESSDDASSSPRSHASATARMSQPLKVTMKTPLSDETVGVHAASIDETAESSADADDDLPRKVATDDVASVVMLRNLSTTCTISDLQNELWHGGFVMMRDYDFMHMPQDYRGMSMGYCVVRFSSDWAMQSFLAAYDGRNLLCCGGRRLSAIAGVKNPTCLQSMTPVATKASPKARQAAAKAKAAAAKGGTSAAATQAAKPQIKLCPACHGQVLSSFAFCTHCGISMAVWEVEAGK